MQIQYNPYQNPSGGELGNSLAVQWLGLGTFTEVAQIQSLVGELRSRKSQHGQKKKKKTNGDFLQKWRNLS